MNQYFRMKLHEKLSHKLNQVFTLKDSYRLRISFMVMTLILPTSFFSCEKVIDLPLKVADPILVIEGNVDNEKNIQEVYISETTPFFYSGDRMPVSGAIVHIQENNTTPVRLEEKENGRYVLSNLKGRSGSTYRLTVLVNDIEYEAQSIMPSPVPLDSVGTINTKVLSEDIKSAAVIYQDPPNQKNYYRFKVKINQIENSTFWAFSDRFTNGNTVTHNLSDRSNKLHSNDMVEIEMKCIDSAVYNYWNGLQRQNPGEASPANPISNISNGALGYFSAHTVSRATFEVK